MTFILLVAILVSVLTAGLLTKLLLHVCHRHGIYDAEACSQNEVNRIPRFGGAVFVPAIFTGLTATILLRLNDHSVNDTVHLSTLLIGCGAMAIYIVGLADDIFGVSQRLKWIIKASACATLPLCSLYINNVYGLFGVYEVTGIVCYLISFIIALIIVESVNALDDTDGLAGCLSLLTFCIVSYNFYALGYYTYAFFGCSLGAAVLVYLYYNLWGDPRIGTKIYMGNCGSLVIGFGLTYLCFKYVMDNKQVMDERPDGLLIPFSTLVIPAFDYVYVFVKSLFVAPPDGKAKFCRIQHLIRSLGHSERATTGLLLLAGILVFAVNMGLDKWLDVNVNIILAIDFLLYVTARRVLTHRVGHSPHGVKLTTNSCGLTEQTGEGAAKAAGDYEYKEGLVSVIMPTWNSEQYVGASIKSIQAQSYTNWELIITDDCSSDGTMEILRRFAEEDPRIRILQNKTNGGAGIARNNCINAAHGQYIAFCDSDDRWTEDKLEKQLAFMREKDVALCFAPYYTCDGKGQYLGYISAPQRVTLFQMMCDNKIGFLTAIYDASKLGKHPMPPQRKRQDHALLLNLLKICKYAYSVPEPLAHYRIHAGNMSGKKLGLLKYNAYTYTAVFGWPKAMSWAFLFVCFLPTYFVKRMRNILLSVMRAASN